MILFGSGSAHLKTTVVSNVTCGNCGKQGTLSFSIYRRHLHIFWIPVFPLNKVGVSQCGHCKQVLRPKEMNGGLKTQYQDFKRGVKGPIWQFIGLFLIVCLIAFAWYSSRADKETAAFYIATPASGKIYGHRLAN